MKVESNMMFLSLLLSAEMGASAVKVYQDGGQRNCHPKQPYFRGLTSTSFWHNVKDSPKLLISISLNTFFHFYSRSNMKFL
jgi:hypothetical protein